ncbi:MAG TPA: T9SS type A sorting domain-containing protein, partial [Bacteroidota bacterium]|nr:T9SS type A sorting domain-containing protein [Bacteroidota bacterium]
IIPPSGGLMPGKVIRLNRGSVSWLYTDNGNQVMTSADNGVTWYVLGGSGGTLPASINNLTVGNWLGGYGSEVYAALNNGQLWVNSQGTWFNRSAGLPAAIVHKVAIHPVYTGVGYALMEGISPILQGNKIFKTIDRGQTWVNISGNLPNLPITDLVAHPNNPNLLYLGTAMGCYKSENGGATWKRWNFGMPEANIITEMSYIDSTTFNGKFYVLAASYGRSIWKRDASTDDPNTTRVVSRRRIPIVGIGHALDTITVTPSPQGGGIRRLTFSLDSLLYSFDGDLIISLLHAGVRDTLVNRVGGEGRNFIGTILDDDATLSLSQGLPPFTGVFRPYEPLSRFDGLPPEGDWILDVHATRPGQAGELIGWSMTISFGSISEVTQQSEVPEHFELEQNYPNPFNPSTTIGFTIQVSGFTSLKVYDVLGREVATLVDEVKQPGSYEVTWNANGVASGVYFYRLLVQRDGIPLYRQTKKFVLVR